MTPPVDIHTVSLQGSLNWLFSTYQGMCFLTTLMGISGIIFITLLGSFSKNVVRPNVEHAFYNVILKHWFNGYFLKHKIIATFIKVNNMGPLIIDSIIHLMGMFFVVAFLSSALTASILHLQLNDFVYSRYLLFLMTANIMLTWSMIKNMLYFRKVLYRLK